MVDIQRLMGAVLYAGRLGGSPYADLASREQVSRTEAQIVQDNCLLHRLPKDGALDVSLEAGFIALPNLLKLQAVMKATGSDLKSAESLPVEIEVPERMHFHTIFACPVSREQAGAGNPPMMLSCGHVISKLALDNIAATRTRFKCPTCRVDQTTSNVRRVFL